MTPTNEQLQAQLDDLRRRLSRRDRTGKLLGFGFLLACATLPLAVSAFDAFEPFEAGDPITAEEMNSRFDAIAGGIDALEAGLVSKQDLFADYALGGKFCGLTDGAFSGALGGYAGAKVQCEATCGTPSSHMCTTEEVVRSAALGLTWDEHGWYSTGVYSYHPSVCLSCPINDCGGWKSTLDSYYGHTWNGGDAGGPNLTACNASNKILCCN